MSAPMLFNPATGEPFGHASDIYREKYPRATWTHNPWTGIKRTQAAVRNDPQGKDLEKKPELHVIPETVDGLLKTIEGTFAWALLMMERGHRVRMLKWRGTPAWVMLIRGEIFAEDHPFLKIRDLASSLDQSYSKQVTFVMRTRDGDFHYGWTPTACSMARDRWELVPDTQA